MTRLRIAVLMGGPSPERDVSMSTGGEIVAALDPRQYDVLPVEITKEGYWLPRPDLLKLTDGNAVTRDPPRSRRALGVERGSAARTDMALSGPGSRLLELLGVPYTGSSVLASALAMDKLRSRQLFEWHRIPVPGYLSVTASVWRDRGHVHRQVAQALGYPCVVKPNAAGSSIGVSLVREPTALDPSVEAAFAYGPIVLIEEYVSGTEITCGILDDPTTGDSVALPLIEVVPHAEFYNYQAKYAAGGSEHIIPARVSAQVAQAAGALALRAHQALGCEGMSRVDMIARGNDLVVLEVNTIPGMTATSLLPDAAKATGIEFPQLLDRIIRSALRRSDERKPGNLKSADH